MKAQVLVPVNAGSDDASNDLWELSVAKDAQRKREDLNALRLSYHRGQAERLRLTMTALITVHENEAQKLLEGGA